MLIQQNHGNLKALSWLLQTQQRPLQTKYHLNGTHVLLGVEDDEHKNTNRVSLGHSFGLLVS